MLIALAVLGAALLIWAGWVLSNVFHDIEEYGKIARGRASGD